jgi:hypothetical protein
VKRLAFALALAACGPAARTTTRPITLASPDRRVDEALAAARQAALEGDLERATETLESLLARAPRDPLAPVARLLLARVTLARGDVHAAERLARATDVASDPALARTRRLVLGVAAARARASGDALTFLRPLEGRLPDRAETAELSCALAESEARAGDPARALRAIAMVDALAMEGTAWLATGLSCEQPDARLALASRVLERLRDPGVLAATLDRLPPDSPLRRPIAVRLRALAEQTHDLGRWLGWLADLPDNSAAPSVSSAASAQRATRVVGVLAPLTGPRSAVGVAMLRGAQYALEQVEGTRVIPEDEGDSPAAIAAAVDRLAARGVRAIVGVSREDLGPAAAIRAQALGIDLWILAPAPGVESTGPRVHLAGPIADARAGALANAMPDAAGGVTLLFAEDAGDVADRLERLLTAAGISVRRAPLDTATRSAPERGAQVVLGTPGREIRAALARAAERAPTRWLFEARAALPGSAGTWVGVRAGPGFAALRATWCARVGEPPDELALLAHDAARAAVARDTPVLAPDLALTAATVAPGRAVPADAPAAAARCE